MIEYRETFKSAMAAATYTPRLFTEQLYFKLFAYKALIGGGNAQSSLFAYNFFFFLSLEKLLTLPINTNL